MKLGPTSLFVILCLMFLCYSLIIYLMPTPEIKRSTFNPKNASIGRLIWQNNNCHTCHQLYGLGGYLGPDLTNVVSNSKKGEAYIRQIIKYGVKQMPSYNLSTDELDNIIEFLKSTNASGSADPRHFKKTYFGMLEQNEVQ